MVILTRSLCALMMFAPALAPAPAQPRCPAGTTASGACANPGLTASVQQRAIIFSQPRLSFLGPPVPFSSDSYADASRDRQGLAFGIDTPVKTTSAPAPAPGTFIGLPTNVNPANLNIAAPYTVVPGGIRIR